MAADGRCTTWKALAFAGIVLLGFAAWRPILRALGVFLVVDDGLRRSDAVVVLSGDSNRERLDTAIAIRRRGLAERIIALTGTSSDLDDEEPGIRRDAERGGLDGGQVVVARGAHSTADDAAIAAEVMKAGGWRSAIVVTSPFHTRRARWTFLRTWSRLGLVLAVHPSRDPRFDPQRWWTDKRNTQAVVLEYVKFGAYMLWYGLFR